MNHTWTIIANPAAGGGRILREKAAVESLLEKGGLPYNWVFTDYPRHAIELIQQKVAKGFRKFAAVGGDGTVHEVINGIMQQNLVESQDILFAQIPMGTGNDWAYMHGIPQNPHGAIELMVNESRRFQDIGRINYQQNEKQKTHYFNNIAGLAYEAFVAEELENVVKHGLWGRLVYFLYTFKCLWKYQCERWKLRADDLELNDFYFLINIGINQFNGNRMRLLPRAIPDDGLFDITYIEKVGPAFVIRNTSKMYNGRIYQSKKIHHHRASVIEISAPNGARIEADGELLGFLPARFEILPKALCFLAPS